MYIYNNIFTHFQINWMLCPTAEHGNLKMRTKNFFYFKVTNTSH